MILEDIHSSLTLHITIINNDGNIYDCIAHLILNMFKGGELNTNLLNSRVKLKNKFSTNSFCVVEDKLISDPTSDEVKISHYYFNIIKNDTGEFLLHKISGESIKLDLLEESYSLC